MFITITSLFREVTTLIINITQHNTTKIHHLLLGQYILASYGIYLKLVSSLKGCIPTPKTLSSLKLKLKLYDCKCFYLLNDDFDGKFQNPFPPKLFTEIFGDLIKKTHRKYFHRKFSQLMYIQLKFRKGRFFSMRITQ